MTNKTYDESVLGMFIDALINSVAPESDEDSPKIKVINLALDKNGNLNPEKIKEAARSLKKECQCECKKEKSNVLKIEGPETLRTMIHGVYFNKDLTTVLWNDGTKTIVKRVAGSKDCKQTAVVYALVKKLFGNNNGYMRVLEEFINKGLKRVENKAKKVAKKKSKKKESKKDEGNK